MTLRGGLDVRSDSFRHGTPSPMAVKRIKGEIAAMEKNAPTFLR